MEGPTTVKKVHGRYKLYRRYVLVVCQGLLEMAMTMCMGIFAQVDHGEVK